MLKFSIYLEDKSSEEISYFLSQKNSFNSVEFHDLKDLIDIEEFMKDENQTFQEFWDMDIEAQAFNGVINDKNFLCITHSGYNLIFTDSGVNLSLKKHHLDDEKIIPSNWILSKFNSPYSFSNMGIEKNISQYTDYDKIESDSSVRYVYKKDNLYISGIQITNNTISNIYTDDSFKKQGYAKKLIEVAKKDFPKLKHSKNRTTLGDYLFKNIKL